MPIEWSIFFTTIALAILGFLWAQSRKIDVIHQALFGVNGRNGVLRNVRAIEEETRTIDERIDDSRLELTNRISAQLAEAQARFIERIDNVRSDITENRRDYTQRFEEVKVDLRALQARKR